MTALVIDARGMPAGTRIALEDVSFAAVIGTVSVSGGDGSQVVFGDAAAQSMVLGADDTLHGGGGNDVVGSRGGNDLLYDDAGDDTVFGGTGNDTLFGGSDRDIVYGNQDADLIYGNQGADSLYGGQGDDVIVGGLGDDILVGGLGADRYVIGVNAGRDLILGFDQAAGDRIALGGQSYAVGSAQNGDAVLVLSGGGSVELAGLRAAQVNAAFLA